MKVSGARIESENMIDFSRNISRIMLSCMYVAPMAELGMRRLRVLSGTACDVALSEVTVEGDSQLGG
jgi:hypothetical protein